MCIYTVYPSISVFSVNQGVYEIGTLYSTLSLPLQYIADVPYNEQQVSVYMSNFTEGSKVNNYTLMVNKDTGVSCTYMYMHKVCSLFRMTP